MHGYAMGSRTKGAPLVMATKRGTQGAVKAHIKITVHDLLRSCVNYPLVNPKTII